MRETVAGNPEVIIIGAGILGLASAYHILKRSRQLDLLVLDRLKGPGRGNTARSAAAYRVMFSSPLNRLWPGAGRDPGLEL